MHGRTAELDLQKGMYAMRTTHVAESTVVFFFGLVAASLAQGPAKEPGISVETGRPAVLSLLGKPLSPPPPGAALQKLERDLAEARARLAEKPDDPDRIIWVARRLGYLWRMEEALAVLNDGIARHPENAALYRHRGHRFISVRRFDEAVVDFVRATKLIAGKPEEIEQDGAPNERNIPLTTLGFNIWYHLGVAHFLRGEFDAAENAFRGCLVHTRGYDDNLVAVTDWRYMCLSRLGKTKEAAALLEPISETMEIIENRSYHRRLLMYKGVLKPEDLLSGDKASPLDVATMGFGVGHWYLCRNEPDKAVETFERVVAGPYWPAFGYIAAEAELARRKADADDSK
jgi:tetratricopeptide (TPR) repeat protein